MKTIALDAMGGDHGVRVVIPAALQVLRKYPDLHLIFVGQEDAMQRHLRSGLARSLQNQWEIQPASEVVEMHEPPAQALRSKKDSSMRVAVNLVHEGRAQACVSAGNTGALMATARFVLKTLPGVDRPAIMTRFPTQIGKEVRVLDVGANVDSSAEQLYQFAVMGYSAAQAVDNLLSPSVGLLNVGEEEIKGNEQVKKTAELLNKCEVVNYAGYVEGDAIFKGVVDVVVCDGFVGNIMLKSCEGIMRFMGRVAKEEFKRSWLSKIGALFVWPVLKHIQKRIDPRRHNGATFLGLNGIVIKSHGSADRIAYSVAIEEAIKEVDKNLSQIIRDKVAEALAAEENL